MRSSVIGVLGATLLGALSSCVYVPLNRRLLTPTSSPCRWLRLQGQLVSAVGVGIGYMVTIPARADGYLDIACAIG
jgi:hypothetical protein